MVLVLALTPLAIVCGNEDEAIERMVVGPGFGFEISRPGWAEVHYDEDMKAVKACGKKVWTKLLKRIGEIDNTKLIGAEEPARNQRVGEAGDDERLTARKVFLVKVSAIAADLKIKELAPVLFSYLGDGDNAFCNLLAVNIGRILEVPDLYRYHRRWFDKETRERFREAVVKVLDADAVKPNE